MIVSHEYELIFLKTHKTAGTSIEVMLSGLVGDDAVVTPILESDPAHTPRNWSGRFNPLPDLISHPRRAGETISQFRSARAFYNHHSWWRVRQRLGADIWNRYHKFCVERDPWDKIASYYFWRVRDLDPQPSFDEWLGRIAAARRDRLSDWAIYADGDEVVVDQVIRYEHLGDELADTLRRVGLGGAGGLPAFKTGYRKARLEFSPWARDEVRRLFAHEIAHFGYADSPPASGD